jgi:hypothetical protein
MSKTLEVTSEWLKILFNVLRSLFQILVVIQDILIETFVFFLSSKRPDQLRRPRNHLLNGTGDSFALSKLSRLRMSGFTPPPLLYAFVVCTRTLRTNPTAYPKIDHDFLPTFFINTPLFDTI